MTPQAKRGRPRKASQPEGHVIARHAFVTEHDGREVLIPEGARLDAAHPIATQHADSFKPDEPEVDLD